MRKTHTCRPQFEHYHGFSALNGYKIRANACVFMCVHKYTLMPVRTVNERFDSSREKININKKTEQNNKRTITKQIILCEICENASEMLWKLA